MCRTSRAGSGSSVRSSRARPIRHRRPAHGQRSRPDLVRGSPADAAARDDRGHRRRRSRDAGRQRRRPRHDGGWSRDDGRLALRSSRPGAHHRRHAHQLARRRRGPRRGRGDAARRPRPPATSASTTSAADPAARVAVALDSASRKSVDALRAAHVRDYQAAVRSRARWTSAPRRPRPPTIACVGSAPAATRVSRRCISSTGATCSSPAPGRARSRRTCRESGTTACRRHGAASTPSTSTPR